jgi:hypothetical protein
MIPLRIGIWMNPSHAAFGGPAQVLLGTVLGFLQSSDDVLLFLNEPGDVNWIVDPPERFHEVDWGTRGLRRVCGPLVFSHADVMIQDPNTSPVWCLGASQLTLYLAPSLWFGKWVSHGLPFYDLSHHRPMVVWGAGVNTDWFRPLPTPVPPLHTYFIYFKSQNWADLRAVHEYLFTNYFRLHGPTIMYYFYSHEELRHAAQNAEFCIMLDATETQGLAALEIMACGCPLFVLDCAEYRGECYSTSEATSVPCWSPECGMKSSVARIAEDFPQFLGKLGAGEYSPRGFVEREYSWAAAAGKLRRMMEALP